MGTAAIVDRLLRSEEPSIRFKVRVEVLDHWLADEFYAEFEASSKAASYRRRGVPRLQGRCRRCASQQGSGAQAAVQRAAERVLAAAKRL